MSLPFARHYDGGYSLRGGDEYAGPGAAQQAYFDMTGKEGTEIAMGYAVAYPLGVVGIIAHSS